MKKYFIKKLNGVEENTNNAILLIFYYFLSRKLTKIDKSHF